MREIFNEIVIQCIECGLVTGEAVVSDGSFLPGNAPEGSKIERLVNVEMSTVKYLDALDAGYDEGAVHRGLEILGITGYCCPRELHNHAMKKGFEHDPGIDRFRCMKSKWLSFYRITYKKTNQRYYRLYRISPKECKGCPCLAHCSVDHGAVRINASPFYPAYHANRAMCRTDEYQRLKRLRSIWSEGTFAALKNWHRLKRIHKRGIFRATEECLLAAVALNLKRMVRALRSYLIFSFGAHPFGLAITI